MMENGFTREQLIELTKDVSRLQEQYLSLKHAFEKHEAGNQILAQKFEIIQEEFVNLKKEVTVMKGFGFVRVEVFRVLMNAIATGLTVLATLKAIGVF